MPLGTVLTMIVAVGVVWGGFVVVLLMALKKERQKSGQ